MVVKYIPSIDQKIHFLNNRIEIAQNGLREAEENREFLRQEIYDKTITIYESIITDCIRKIDRLVSSKRYR